MVVPMEQATLVEIISCKNLVFCSECDHEAILLFKLKIYLDTILNHKMHDIFYLEIQHTSCTFKCAQVPGVKNQV